MKGGIYARGATLACVVVACLGAMCIPAHAAKPVVAAKSFTPSPFNFGFGSESVGCDRGLRATGAGVVPKGEVAAPELNGSAPLPKGDGDTPVRAYAAVWAPEEKFKAFAICQPRSDARVATTAILAQPQQTTYGVAVCPEGERVIGGGVAAVDRSTWNPVRVQSSGPLSIGATPESTGDGDEAWLWYAAVFGDFTAPGSPVPMTVYAVCSRRSDATIQANEKSVSANSSDQISVRCNGERDALSGGFVQSGPPDGLRAQWSAPKRASKNPSRLRDGATPTGWMGAVENTTGANRTVEAYVICD